MTVRDYSATEFKRKFGDVPEGITSLVTSASAFLGGSEIDETSYLAMRSQTLSLETDFSHFLVALYFYLVTKGCPGTAIDLVAVITAVTGGNSERLTELTDKLLAEVMNVSERTIRTKRRALKDWMKFNRQAVVQIEEGEYNHQIKCNAPTQYRVLIAPIASRIVLAARNGHLWKKDEPQAQKRALNQAAVDAVWNEEDAPPPVKERKKKKQKSPAKEIETRRKTIFTNFKKIIGLEFKHGSPESWYEDFLLDLGATYTKEMENHQKTGGIF